MTPSSVIPAYESITMSVNPTTYSTMTAVGNRVGIDPISRVYSIENNDEAYDIWRAAKVDNRILVHIDAHPDLDWCSDDSHVSISNFISRAMAQGLVREVYWIIPDPTWHDAGCRKVLIRYMQEMLSYYPGRHPAPRVRDDEVTMEVFETRIRVRPLHALPRLEEPVLLDLDTDFLLIPLVPDEEGRAPSKLPWCWPDELITCLATYQLRADIVTIAYSVEGGFTPLRWKCLADELACRISQPIHAVTHPLWALKRQAGIAQANGQLEEAERALTQLIALDSHDASSYFRLAHLFAEQNSPQQARACYQRAIAEDPSYGTAYSSDALAYLACGDLDRAERECRRTLLCNPEDVCAHYGLGRIATARRRWTSALESLHHAIDLSPRFLDAHSALAAVLECAGRLDEAIAASENALMLSCSQALSLSDKFITSRVLLAHRVDRKHFELYRRLSHLYAKRGRFHDAITSYRIWLASVMGGRLRDRLWLMWLYGLQGQFWDALKAAVAEPPPNVYRPITIGAQEQEYDGGGLRLNEWHCGRDPLYERTG